VPEGYSVNRILNAFVPSAYWEIFCTHRKLDLLKYPALRYDYDYAAGRDAIYGIFSFEQITANGQLTGGIRITYKGLWSRQTFQVDAYPEREG